MLVLKVITLPTQPLVCPVLRVHQALETQLPVLHVPVVKYQWEVVFAKTVLVVQFLISLVLLVLCVLEELSLRKRVYLVKSAHLTLILMMELANVILAVLELK